MEVKELISISPVRVFEKSISGGLGRGNLGVLASYHGVGKTAVMVDLAIDKLLRGENIVHVSFGSNVEHVMNWYKEAFRQITELKSLDDAVSVYETIREQRVMMNFSQENVGVDRILKSLETLIQQGSFKADAIFFDGYKLTKATEEDVKKIKTFAEKMNLEVWFSVSPVTKDVKCDAIGIPETLNPVMDKIEVLVGLHFNEAKSSVIITIVQEHGKKIIHPAGVSLDPQTMLISK